MHKLFLSLMHIYTSTFLKGTHTHTYHKVPAQSFWVMWIYSAEVCKLQCEAPLSMWSLKQRSEGKGRECQGGQVVGEHVSQGPAPKAENEIPPGGILSTHKPAGEAGTQGGGGGGHRRQGTASSETPTGCSQQSKRCQ